LRCSVLQHIAVFCITTYCGVLYYNILRCSVLQQIHLPQIIIL